MSLPNHIKYTDTCTEEHAQEYIKAVYPRIKHPENYTLVACLTPAGLKHREARLDAEFERTLATSDSS